jgi:methylated-DNA-[protein]-cysteine S-methyltransferase
MSDAGRVPRADQGVSWGDEGLDELARLLRAEADRFAAEAVDTTALAAAAAGADLLDVAWCEVDSPIGPLVVAGTQAGLLTVSFSDVDTTLEGLARQVSPRILEHPARLDLVRRQLDEYFEDRRHHFELPLDRRLSKGFRARVLAELERVPFGVVVTYGELAARVGNPRAFRAVGTAMATNPLPIVVPCHRVLRSGGKLGGYGGGLDAKRWLLRHEGAPVPPS